MESFAQKVSNTIEKYQMLDGGKVTVGLSGGADSVALTRSLMQLGLEVRAVHVNHMLRGEESLRDEGFCRELCKKLGVEFFCHHVDVRSYAREKSLSVETAARELRYQIFEKYSKDGRFATAHNADDCFETAIFHLVRGTGLKGLEGIPAKRGQFIRPLIETSRQEIIRYLEELSQDYVTDSTNLLPDCSRNKIRLSVVPELREVNGELLKNYLRSRDNFMEEEDFLERTAEEAFNDALLRWDGKQCYSVEKIASLHPAVRNRVLRKILESQEIEVSRDKITRLVQLCEGGKVNLMKDTFALCSNGRLWFEKGASPKAGGKISIPAQVGVKMKFFERNVTLKVTELSKDENVNRKFTKWQADYDKIKGQIILKNRDGDAGIRLFGRDFTSSLSKLLSGAFPVEEREKAVLLEDGGGLCFVEKYGFDRRLACGTDTRRVLEVIAE